MKKIIRTFSALLMVIFAAAAAFAQTSQILNPGSEKIELNKVGETKDASYDMKGGETRKIEIMVKELGKLQFNFPIYAPMFKTAEDVAAADNPVSRAQPSPVVQKSLEWKLRNSDKEIGSGTNLPKFVQLAGRIIPSSIQYDQVLLQPGTLLWRSNARLILPSAKTRQHLCW